MTIKIDLKNLDKKESLIEFLKGKVEIKEQEDLLLIEEKVDKIKTYIKRFLYKEGLKEKYKVRVNKGVITFSKLS
ncbi:hypothetical protein HRbin06_00275 [archaeon HR06]|nr:hypothetical protein HRbin06_00275 [archaeon HR06]